MPNDAIEQRRWERAIDAAAEKDILMFCSAADAGQFGETTFPHHCRPKTTFRVGAAHDTGQIYEHVANADKLDFAMPGFELFLPDEEGATNSRSEKSRDSSAIHVDKENPLESYTGSSVATALAAGLAALVLECVRIGCARDIETERDSDGTIVLSDLAVIRQRENLKTAFTEGIGTSKDSGQNMDKFIMANNIFAEYYRKLDTEDDDNRRETIATLARELLRKRW
jgi:hypothetical protein